MPRAGENDWLKWVTTFVARDDARIRVAAGDDAAVLDADSLGHVVVATDTVILGVHFDEHANPADIGWKAVAVNLSDVAAMGVYPTAAVIVVAADATISRDTLEGIMQGARQAAEEYDVSIVGGDFSSCPAGLHVTVTLLGETRDLEPIRRDGARPGDTLLTTGTLGGSLLGRHLHFRPRVAEGLRLNRDHAAHAMMDISDGLAMDANRLAHASGVILRLHEEKIPVAEAAATRGRQTGRSALDHALHDGEDFELLVALEAGAARRALADPALAGLTAIGTVLAPESVESEPAAPRLEMRRNDGTIETLEAVGYEHPLDSSH